MLVGGRISGRKESERGQIGVRRIEGREGWISGPEAEREYAVEPVGVDKISPSAYKISVSIISGYVDVEGAVGVGAWGGGLLLL